MRPLDGVEKAISGRQFAVAFAPEEAYRIDTTQHAAEGAETGLGTNSRRLLDLALHLPQTVWEVDLAGDLVFVNQQGFEIYGYSREQPDAPRNGLGTFVREDRERVTRDMRRILRGETLDGTECTALKGDGTTFPIIVYASPVLREGRPAGLRGITIDVTRRKQTERELMRYRSRLEKRLAERTSQLRHAQERAITDELTSLHNRRYFEERIKEEIARCIRFGDLLSLIFIDVDHLKEINDSHGHLVGDEVLRLLAQDVLRSLRSVDLGFRYGGDEFAVILPGTDLAGASRTAERIRERVAQRTDPAGGAISCSIGVASWPSDGISQDDVIESSDAALYTAKRSGRNRVDLACDVAASGVLEAPPQTASDSRRILRMVYSLASAVDAKVHHAPNHSRRVSDYAADLSLSLGYSQEDADRIREAALLHDIGKIAISGESLSKAGSLATEDREQIRAHPRQGVSILRHVPELTECLAAVEHHHERYDGAGYPAGLRGTRIPFDARILAVADSYDAMTSPRPYRPALPSEKALEEIRRGAGSQYDPEVAYTFIGIMSGDLAVVA